MASEGESGADRPEEPAGVPPAGGSGAGEPGSDAAAKAAPAPAETKPRAKATIMDLARYRVGQRVWWVVFRNARRADSDPAEEWMKTAHPYVLFKRKVIEWEIPMRPPRTHPGDTIAILMLCCQRPKVEPFRIDAVERSPHTGEFIYTGPKGTAMPEGLLFPTKKAARKEIARLVKLFGKWTESWSTEPKGDAP